jgi:L-lactate dehydrogenase (cytochrome)
MRLKHCHSSADFRRLARRRLPGPIFHYIDGGADDEVTLRRNEEAYEACDLVPNVLAGVEEIDMRVTVMGQQLDMPFFLAPTALQRLFHPDGEHAVAAAAEKFGTFFGISTMATATIEEIGARVSSPKMFQLYVHKDHGLTCDLVDRARDAGYQALVLTVDAIVSGHRERDLRTGFTTPLRLNLKSLLSFAAHPAWTYRYLAGPRIELATLKDYVKEGTSVEISVADYISNMLDQSMDWQSAEEIAKRWGGPIALKGVMSAEDAKRAVDIGASAIIVSNHGGRQLDGSRAPFDQLAEIVDAVGDRAEVICDGGIRRGTHILKALSLGATACSGGRAYLYALAAADQPGVEHALQLLRDEIERDMKLMGVRSIGELGRGSLRFR